MLKPLTDDEILDRVLGFLKYFEQGFRLREEFEGELEYRERCREWEKYASPLYALARQYEYAVSPKH